MKDLRRELREPAIGSVTYSFKENGSGITHAGLLSNLSQNGACIYTQHCIADGQVKVYISSLSSDPISVDVMWCRQAIDNLYVAGIRFRN